MFKSLQSSDSFDEHVFTVKVGSNGKETLAGWHVEETEDVVAALAMLVA